MGIKAAKFSASTGGKLDNSMTKSDHLAAFAPVLGLNPEASLGFFSPFLVNLNLTEQLLGGNNFLEVANGLSNPATSEVLSWSSHRRE